MYLQNVILLFLKYEQKCRNLLGHAQHKVSLFLLFTFTFEFNIHVW